MKSFTVGAADAGRRLDAYLRRHAPDLPPGALYKGIREKNIKVNGRRAEGGTRLSEGDRVDVYLPDAFLGEREEYDDFLFAGGSLEVAYEDENIIIPDKPQGLLCHPDGREYRDTLISRIQRYLYEKGEFRPERGDFAPALANRLDRGTGGLVLAAKNAEALRVLDGKIREREVDKYYLLVTRGSPPRREGTLMGYIAKDAERNLVTVTRRPEEGARTAATEYRVLAERDGLCLIRARLLTGRTHQIRAQFAAAGCPLLGDGKYGRRPGGAAAPGGGIPAGGGASAGGGVPEDGWNPPGGRPEMSGRVPAGGRNPAGEGPRSSGGGRPDRVPGYTRQALYCYRVDFSFTTPAGALDYLAGKSVYAREVWFAKELFGVEELGE